MTRLQKLLLPAILLFVVVGTTPAYAGTAQHEVLVNAVEGKAIEVKDKKVFQEQFLYSTKKLAATADNSSVLFDAPHAYYCSGFIQDLYRINGVWLPAHSVAQQTRYGMRVDKLTDIEPGDIVFLSGSILGNVPAHVAVSIGGGKLLHAAGSGKQLSVVAITPEIKQHFLFATRLVSSV